MMSSERLMEVLQEEIAEINNKLDELEAQGIDTLPDCKKDLYRFKTERMMAYWHIISLIENN